MKDLPHRMELWGALGELLVLPATVGSCDPGSPPEANGSSTSLGRTVVTLGASSQGKLPACSVSSDYEGICTR